MVCTASCRHELHQYNSIIINYVAIAGGDARQSLMLSEKALNAVQSVSEDSLPNKLQYVAMLHSHIGTAQLELGKVDLAMEQFEKDMEIANAE